MSCEQCFRESRIDRRLTRPPQQNASQHKTAPKDAMQIDFVPAKPPSRGYETIGTSKEVFPRILFAYNTSNQEANAIAKVIFKILTQHAYLPRTTISDKGSAFMPHVIKEVAGVFAITLKHATTKHVQTSMKLERSHASIKQALEVETGERRSLWLKYVNVAVLNYSTSSLQLMPTLFVPTILTNMRKQMNKDISTSTKHGIPTIKLVDLCKQSQNSCTKFFDLWTCSIAQSNLSQMGTSYHFCGRDSAPEVSFGTV